MAIPKTVSMTEEEKRNPDDELVDIRLSLLEAEGHGKIDQTVNVTRNGETLVIQRGTHVKIPKWAFIQLAQSGRFPEL